MNQTPRFCSNCGKPLNPGARFCGSCGATVQAIPAAPQPPPQQPQYTPPPQPQYAPPPQQPQYAPPPQPQYAPPPANMPQPQYAPAQPSEIVLGVIPGGTRRSGFLGFKAESYTIVATSHRLLFAPFTTRIQKESVNQAREAAKAQGKGFFGQWGAQLTSGSGARYLGMPPEAILAEESGSFFLMNNQVRSFRFSSQDDDETNRTTYYLEIQSVTDKLKFEFSALDERAAKDLLRRTLGAVGR